MRVEREEKKTPHTYMVAICSDFRVLKEEEKKKSLASSESLIIGSEYLRLNREDT